LQSPSSSSPNCSQRGAQIIARQQLAPVYHRNGLAYAITRQCLIEQKSIKGAKTGAVIAEGNLPNIYTELDLEWAEFMLARQERGSGG
jgi:CMP-N-acetylneuraminic acid synthetase